MIAVFRHIPFEHLGSIAGGLDKDRIEYRYFDLYTYDVSAPDLDFVSGIILMGGPMSANDPDPYLAQETAFIRQAHARGIPILGICLGAQLIAKAFGAKVYANKVKEIGWYPVCLTESAETDPLFRGLASTQTVFHWHGETFHLPEGAVLLASSERCRHQAFRLGESIYGLQFHPEVTPAMIEDWLQQDANCGDARELSEPIDPHAHQESMSELCRILTDRWITQVVKRPGA